MDINFDVNKVFQERLAASMGLDKYQFIMEQVKLTPYFWYAGRDSNPRPTGS